MGIRSLVLATDIDVLPVDRVLSRRPGYWVVRSPSNPAHFWGNLLVYDRPPGPGDGRRWLGDFAAEFPGLGHRTFSWDTVGGELGNAATEFPGFETERMIGLVARSADLRDHPRADTQVAVRVLEPGDDAAWEAVAELWMAQNAAAADPHPLELHRRFTHSRLADLRELFRQGRGAWYGAYDGDRLAGSLGVVVTGSRARYQQVDTRTSHRGRGVASRLVLAAGRRTLEQFNVDSLVIAADADYHALGIYESLGFRRAERVSGVWSRPPAVA